MSFVEMGGIEIAMIKDILKQRIEIDESYREDYRYRIIR